MTYLSINALYTTEAKSWGFKWLERLWPCWMEIISEVYFVRIQTQLDQLGTFQQEHQADQDILDVPKWLFVAKTTTRHLQNSPSFPTNEGLAVQKASFFSLHSWARLGQLDAVLCFCVVWNTKHLHTLIMDSFTAYFGNISANVVVPQPLMQLCMK